MDSIKSDSIPLTMHTDVANVYFGVDPGVNMALPNTETPPLPTLYGGSYSASPMQLDLPISMVTAPNAWSKPLTFT